MNTKNFFIELSILSEDEFETLNSNAEVSIESSNKITLKINIKKYFDFKIIRKINNFIIENFENFSSLYEFNVENFICDEKTYKEFIDSLEITPVAYVNVLGLISKNIKIENDVISYTINTQNDKNVIENFLNNLIIFEDINSSYNILFLFKNFLKISSCNFIEKKMEEIKIELPDFSTKKEYPKTFKKYEPKKPKSEKIMTIHAINAIDKSELDEEAVGEKSFVNPYNSVTFNGMVTSIDIRETKNGTMYSYNVFDYISGISVKSYLSSDTSKVNYGLTKEELLNIKTNK
jgi:hypothetical protein